MDRWICIKTVRMGCEGLLVSRLCGKDIRDVLTFSYLSYLRKQVSIRKIQPFTLTNSVTQTGPNALSK